MELEKIETNPYILFKGIMYKRLLGKLKKINFERVTPLLIKVIINFEFVIFKEKENSPNQIRESFIIEDYVKNKEKIEDYIVILKEEKIKELLLKLERNLKRKNNILKNLNFKN